MDSLVKFVKKLKEELDSCSSKGDIEHLLRQRLNKLEMLDDIPIPIYGCHCDLESGFEPDGCVLDEGKPEDCIHAKPLFERGESKWKCPYWREIK